MSYSEVQTLTEKLISIPSVTPNDLGCQQLIADYLEALGFKITHLPCSEVSNLWAVYSRNQNNNTSEDTNYPVLVFAGHTDVVPSGPLEKWQSDPFKPTIKNDLLYGRGAADMKGSLAAMLVATKNFLQNNKDFNGSIGFLITSDEEGPAIHGTKHVVSELLKKKQKIDYCIIGEPSSSEYCGDIIKNGRRGSLSGNLTIYGTQGHAAYPHKANNAVHISLKFLQELIAITWDQGNADFPPTTLQIINAEAGTGVSNIIPGAFNIEFNFRYSTCHNYDSLISKVENLLAEYQLKYDLDWKRYAEPFLTQQGGFTHMIQSAVKSVTGKQCNLATTGGTSDGRFILPAFQCELIELGPLNHSIHHINEHVSISDLITLTKIYEKSLKLLFTENYIGTYQCNTAAAS